ncbi:hypothetical protein F5Y06DRAFT_263258, partial [Hypoxylon sp. FL0890]
MPRADRIPCWNGTTVSWCAHISMSSALAPIGQSQTQEKLGTNACGRGYLILGHASERGLVLLECARRGIGKIEGFYIESRGVVSRQRLFD